ncbi:hypothetical protein NSK_004948 [Nannochloropsis salina CCMP1776]|uniref:Uncharacterized protein n=1 Tax=Nannochloropsis salina CCMP1776 TaxID=1027361 RepID=A0A4D9CWX6_9STRA|nr:hypothetical protein NSK_004948 [Nannochloropsis salina CCMP1776]|eukprot:TFJ83851.1 hypothetical protein NSK_004948 [Nannochloropsis salina CCMP1776]
MGTTLVDERNLPISASIEPHQDQHVAVILRFLRARGTEGACLLGPQECGKSSLAFQLCYTMAQQDPNRQAIFIHRHRDSRHVVKTTRLVVASSRPSSSPAVEPHHQSEQTGPSCVGRAKGWDFSVLDNVFLKRFTSVQGLCWYFGSLHNQPDALLPSVIVVDDLDRYISTTNRDDDSLSAYCQVLSVIRDAAEHIRQRTGHHCSLVVTMEQASRGLLLPLIRQLGMILRISGDQNHKGGESMAIWKLEEDMESRNGDTVGGEGAVSGYCCRYDATEKGVLRVLEMSEEKE